MLVRAVSSLSKRGLSVFAVKHSPRMVRWSENTRPGDAERLLDAGAERVVLAGSCFTVRFEPSEEPVVGGPSGLSEILESLKANGQKYVLIEGYKSSREPIQRIVFGKNEREIRDLADGRTVGFSGTGAEGLKITGIPYLPLTVGENELADFITGLFT